MAITLQMPPVLAEHTTRYLSLFRPAGRALSWSRTLKLIRELYELIEAGQIKRKGRTWPAPTQSWCMAMEQMIEGRDKLTLPLKSHGYLYEIVAGLGDKIEATEETRKEKSLRNQSASYGNEKRSELESLHILYKGAPNDPLKQQIEDLEKELFTGD